MFQPSNGDWGLEFDWVVNSVFFGVLFLISNVQSFLGAFFKRHFLREMEIFMYLKSYHLDFLISLFLNQFVSHNWQQLDKDMGLILYLPETDSESGGIGSWKMLIIK